MNLHAKDIEDEWMLESDRRGDSALGVVLEHSTEKILEQRLFNTSSHSDKIDSQER